MFKSANDTITVTEDRDTVVLLSTVRAAMADDTTAFEVCAGNGNDTITTDDMDGLIAGMSDFGSFDLALAA